MSAHGINSNGDVIGSAADHAAIYWSDTGTFELLPNLKDGWMCSGLALNNQGQAVGMCHDLSSAINGVAVMWQDHKAVELANPCGTGEGLPSYARSISDSGVIGGTAGNCAMTWHVSSPDKAVIMAANGAITAINTRGEMVGVVAKPDAPPGMFGSTPARWTNENAPAIDLSPDATISGYPRWINDRGRSVGVINVKPGEAFAFVSQ